MTQYLQLYLDIDFILPIGVNATGGFQKYIDSSARRRLWLFFSKESATSRYVATDANKAGFESGQLGFYGDFWKHLENNDKVSGEVFYYQDFLELSGIISTLKEWSLSVIGINQPDVVLNFSTIIPLKARRTFSDYIERKIGKIRTFSIELNDLLSSKVTLDYKTITPQFGDQMLIAQSIGNDILLSTMTWCNNQFMQGKESYRIEKKGNDFLKMSLVRLVVEYQEKMEDKLKPDQFEKECSYQMQYADEWLNQRHGEDSFLVRGFHYSDNPSKIYPPIRIDGKQLKIIEEESIRKTIDKISLFYKDNIVKTHLFTILMGDVFTGSVFREKFLDATQSDGKYVVFDDNAVQEAMGRYFVLYSTKEEPLNGLERLYNDRINDRLRINSFVRNAEMLGALITDAENIVLRLKTAIQTVKDRNADLLKSWEALMRCSAFSDSEILVNQMSISDELTIASKESFEFLKRVEENNSLLIELDQKDAFKHIIQTVRNLENKLETLRINANELTELPGSLKSKIQKYKDLYPKYLEMKKQFEIENTLSGRKRLVEQMMSMTMEDMPVIDVENITGNVEVSVAKSGGIMGFGVKKIIKVTLNIDKPLPCRSVLIISKNVIASIPKDRNGVYSVDVEKGLKGEVVKLETTLEQMGFDKALKTIFIKFWPHENEKIPINRFEISGCGIKNI